MATCPMCNAEVEDMDQHSNEAHGDSGGGDAAPAEGGDAGGDTSGGGDAAPAEGGDAGGTETPGA